MLLQRVRTLRLRLTMLYVVIFGLTQSVLWISVDYSLTRYLHRAFDRSLEQRAQVLVETLTEHGGDLTDPAGQQDRATALRPFEAGDVYFEVRSADQRTLIRSTNLGGNGLPPTPPPPAAEHAAFATVRMPGDSGSAPPTGLRVVTLVAHMPERSPVYVQLGVSLAPMQSTIREIRRMLVSFVFLSLVVAAVTSWYLARRSLAPIGQIARQARELGVSRLEERIPAPDTHDEVAEMVTVINGMLARLEAEFRNQQRFIAEVSHELRTPLAVLLGEAQALKRQAAAPVNAEFVATVEEEARQMLRIVESFLVLTRVRAGARPPVVANVSIEETVLRAVQKGQSDARARGVFLRPRLGAAEGRPEPIVAGDAELLYALVANLVHHALRQSGAGDTVDIAVEPGAHDVVLCVRDTGPPIPEDQLPRIFDLFRRVRPGDQGGAGTGVELSVVKGVAELHGGSVEARNHPEGGGEFIVRLPLAHTA